MEARIVRNSTPETIRFIDDYQRKGKMIINHLLLLSDAKVSPKLKGQKIRSCRGGAKSAFYFFITELIVQ